ncbi:MAG: hypothetical protein ACT4OE_03650 [Sphingosinicella sp.]
MRKILLGMTAVSAIALAAPLVAQSNSQTDAQFTAAYESRFEIVETRIDAGIRAGTISEAEARELRRDLRELARLEGRYGANGFNSAERNELAGRIRALRDDVRTADGGRGDRFDRWQDEDAMAGGRIDRNGDGFDDRDLDRDGRWEDDAEFAGRIDRNRDGFDDRDFDRDGRWDDDYYGGNFGRGGPDDGISDCRVGAAVESRAGVGGLLDSILGRGTLRVGSRVSGSLYAVPNECRDEFRDTAHSFFRSDGRAIYEIDARTHTVVRIFPLER